MSRWNGLVLAIAGLVLIPSMASRAAEEPKDWEIPDPSKVEKKEGDRVGEGDRERPHGEGEHRDGDRPREGGDKPEWKKDGGEKPEWKKDGGDRQNEGGDKPEWKKDGADRPDGKKEGGDGEHRDKPRGEAVELKEMPQELKGFNGQVCGVVVSKEGNFITFKVNDVTRVWERANKASNTDALANKIIKVAPGQERGKFNQNHIAYLRTLEKGAEATLNIRAHESAAGFVLTELSWEQRKQAGLPVDGDGREGGDRPHGKDGGDKPEWKKDGGEKPRGDGR